MHMSYLNISHQQPCTDEIVSGWAPTISCFIDEIGNYYVGNVGKSEGPNKISSDQTDKYRGTLDVENIGD